jgi:hypothetical protein
MDSHRSEDDALFYGDDRPGGNVYLQDADELDRPEFYYGSQGNMFMQLNFYASCSSHHSGVVTHLCGVNLLLALIDIRTVIICHSIVVLS